MDTGCSLPESRRMTRLSKPQQAGAATTKTATRTDAAHTANWEGLLPYLCFMRGDGFVPKWNKYAVKWGLAPKCCQKIGKIKGAYGLWLAIRLHPQQVYTPPSWFDSAGVRSESVSALCEGIAVGQAHGILPGRHWLAGRDPDFRTCQSLSHLWGQHPPIPGDRDVPGRAERPWSWQMMLLLVSKQVMSNVGMEMRTHAYIHAYTHVHAQTEHMLHTIHVLHWIELPYKHFIHYMHTCKHFITVQ